MDKREQILEATANLIAECGLQSPISLVAKQACCGAGTIYRYFDTKEELIEMVYLKQMERLSDACLANNDNTGRVREQLHNIWSNLFHYLNDSPRDAALLDQLGVAPDVREELQLKAQELQHKMQTDMAKIQLEAEKIKAQNQREGAKLGVTLATELDKNQREDQQEGAKLGIEVAKELTKGNG